MTIICKFTLLRNENNISLLTNLFKFVALTFFFHKFSSCDVQIT